MKYVSIIFFFYLLALNASATTLPQIQVVDLFKKADVVALVDIKKGETIDIEGNSCGAVYEGKVIEAFKGTEKEKIVIFGPYYGYRIGFKYILFLNNAENVFDPISSTNSRSEAARQEYLNKCQSQPKGLRIMHSGYGALKIEFTGKYKYKDAAIIPKRYVSFPFTLPRKKVDEGKCDKWQECYWIPEDRLIKYFHKLKNEL